jgi:UDP-N-acetylglucosamine acyltransferase
VPIHPTAVVDPRAELDATADIGPYVVIDGPVTIGPRTRVLAHAFLTGQTTIGADNVIHPSAVVGHEPQDLKYRGAPTGLRVGDRNVIREHVEIHRGTAPETSTVIGDDNYFMGQSHVGHNSTVGSHVILASGALLAGHVTIEDQVFVSGNCVVHQFTRIGRLALLRGLSRTSRDVPPFALMDETHTIRGVNRVGLRRAGFDAARIRAVVNAYRTLFRVRVNLRDAMAEVEAGPRTPDVDAILAFIREAKRGVAMGPARPGAARDTGDDD